MLNASSLSNKIGGKEASSTLTYVFHNSATFLRAKPNLFCATCNFSRFIYFLHLRMFLAREIILMPGVKFHIS